MKKTKAFLGFGALSVALIGCATGRPWVDNDTRFPVTSTDSANHAITELHLYEHDGELVLYGKVSHRHGSGAEEAHLDLAITDASGRTVEVESLPVQQASLKKRGFWGASFRAHLEPLPAGDAKLRLAFHEGREAPMPPFGCGQREHPAPNNAPEIKP